MNLLLGATAVAIGLASPVDDTTKRVGNLWNRAVSSQTQGELAAADSAARQALALLDGKQSGIVQVEFVAGQDDPRPPRKVQEKRRVDFEVREDRGPRGGDESEAVKNLRRRIEAAERELNEIRRRPTPTPPRGPMPRVAAPLQEKRALVAPTPPRPPQPPQPPRVEMRTEERRIEKREETPRTGPAQRGEMRERTPNPRFLPPQPVTPPEVAIARRLAPFGGPRGPASPPPVGPEKGTPMDAIKHLRMAAEHLQQGGMPDVAREVMRRAEELERQARPDARRDGPSPEIRETVERLQKEMHTTVMQMQEEMRRALEQTRAEARKQVEGMHRQLEETIRAMKMQMAATAKTDVAKRDGEPKLQQEMMRLKEIAEVERLQAVEMRRRLEAELVRNEAIRQKLEAEIARQAKLLDVSRSEESTARKRQTEEVVRLRDAMAELANREEAIVKRERDAQIEIENRRKEVDQLRKLAEDAQRRAKAKAESRAKKK